MGKLNWRSAVPQLVSGPEYCPTAVEDYFESSKTRKKTPDDVLLSFRKHLLFCGWKIDCALDKETIRMRYSPPSDDQWFYSLSTVCAKILGRTPTNRNKIPLKTTLARAPTNRNKTPLKATRARLAIAPPKVVQPPPQNPRVPGEFSALCAPSDEVVVEPEYCPEAVSNYCLLAPDVDRKPITMKVKQHLSAIGWSFYYTIKGEARRELRYCSPNGKVFNSLITACKWCVEARALTFDDLMGNSRNVNVDVNANAIVKASRKRKHDDIVQYSKKGRKPKWKSQSTKKVRDTSASTFNRNPKTVLSWLIDNDMVLPRAKVEYRGKNGLPMAEGRIARKGIICNCCGVIFTLTRFEAHAGSYNHRPSAHIFLEDGRSLMDCQLQLRETRGHRLTENVGTNGIKTNDDICSSCHYGGELVLCDQCPSAYHTQCLGLKEVPDGDWFCPSCCCRICGTGRYGFDGEDGEEIIDCSARTCTQCAHRYHAECLRIKGITKCYQEGYWFCQDSCEQIFCGLHKILGKPVPVGTDNLTWTLLKYVKRDSCDQYASDDESTLESYGKLNVALSVMHECFEPVKQAATGRDMVEDVIFNKWSELNRMNFQGFYTIVLEKNEELISAAAVRIYGKRVAEVPLVATRFQYRRLGMCRILMNELEKKLMDLGVENLVLPAVPTVLNTWTNSFGFSVMKEADRLKFLDCTFLDFQGTTLCQKVLMCNPSSVPSQATGRHEKSCERASKNVSPELDGTSTMSEISEGDSEEESTSWIDELLLNG